VAGYHSRVAHFLLVFAALLQAMAVGYGIFLLRRRRGAAAGWLFLLGAMTSMLAWRVFVIAGVQPPPYFNPAIAVWGSSCMVAAMYFFGREGALRVKAEAERDALLSSERTARETAEHASRLKDEFLATASHELRTPLSVILSWCAILKTGRTAEAENEKAIEIIERNARIQSRLVDDLLDMTRMQAGNLQLDLHAVPLDVPVRAALLSVTPAADAKNIELSFSIPGNPPVVSGDPGRLQQITGNLLTNAIKFTQIGGRIEVIVDSVGDRARLTVRDNGEGIDAEFLPRLFGRFQQADSSTTRHHGGLGLGLSIVANLARMHGGAVHASSAGRGLGSAFVVELPLTTQEIAPLSVLHEVNGDSSLTGVRILMIDDEQDVRDATSALLEKVGAEVRSLDSPREVIAEIAKFQPHLLILDIGMPDEDGYSVMRRIRGATNEHARRIPAISLTAHAREEDRARAFAAGFQDHLPKPIEVSRLAGAIRRLVDLRPTFQPERHREDFPGPATAHHSA
jgi:signal transduction histidine kinase/ActR/RegA family two-component response regulator